MTMKYTIREVAKMLGVTRAHVYNLIKSGRLNAMEIDEPLKNQRQVNTYRKKVIDGVALARFVVLHCIEARQSGEVIKRGKRPKISSASVLQYPEKK